MDLRGKAALKGSAHSARPDSLPLSSALSSGDFLPKRSLPAYRYKNPLMTGLNLTFCLLNPLLLILSPLDTAKKEHSLPCDSDLFVFKAPTVSPVFSAKSPSYLGHEYAGKALYPTGQIIHLFFQGKRFCIQLYQSCRLLHKRLSDL